MTTKWQITQMLGRPAKDSLYLTVGGNFALRSFTRTDDRLLTASSPSSLLEDSDSDGDKRGLACPALDLPCCGAVHNSPTTTLLPPTNKTHTRYTHFLRHQASAKAVPSNTRWFHEDLVMRLFFGVRNCCAFRQDTVSDKRSQCLRRSGGAAEHNNTTNTEQ